MEKYCDFHRDLNEPIKLSDYEKLMDECVNLLDEINDIFIITSDIFFDSNVKRLINNKTFNDLFSLFSTIKDKDKLITEIFSNKMSNSDEIYKFVKTNSDKENLESNTFIKNISKLDKIIDSNCLLSFKNEKINSLNFKKKYEVEVFGEFILSRFYENINKNNAFIELGCGKSHLYQHLNSVKNDLIYIGIDKQSELIDKTEDTNKDNNLLVIDAFVDQHNFRDIDCELISPFIQEKLKNTNITKYEKTLIGLHSCGNLTSDGLRIYSNQNSNIDNIAIIGCCLNLLTEHISSKVKESEKFEFYLNNLGTNKNGNSLDDTLVYDEQLTYGFPLSNYTQKKEFFLGRAIRNAGMQSQNIFIDKTQRENLDKLYYRSIFQKFLDDYNNDLRFSYGFFGKIKIKKFKDYSEYSNAILANILKKKSNEENIIKLIENLKNCDLINNYENKITSNLKQINILFDAKSFFICYYIIRIKFAYIIEVIVALDRLIFLYENGLKNSFIYKIFDKSFSERNLLVFSSKKSFEL